MPWPIQLDPQHGGHAFFDALRRSENCSTFTRGEYMSKKIWNCRSSNLGILKLSVLINQKIFKTVYQNFLKTVYQIFLKPKSIFVKQCWRMSSTCIALSIWRRLSCVCGQKPKMPKDFSSYFPHLFGPKLSITSINFWNCLWVLKLSVLKRTGKGLFIHPWAVLGCTWLDLAVLGCTWLNLAVPGCTWLY